MNNIKHGVDIGTAGCGRSLEVDDVRPTAKSYGIGEVINALKTGRTAARLGWNGNAQFITLIQPPQSACPSEYMYDVELAYVPVAYTLRPWIAIKTVGNELMPWVASQSDILAEDWTLSNEIKNPV